MPPLACRRVEYDEPFVPEGTDDVVSVRVGAATTSERVADLVCGAGLDESVTVKVRLEEPLAVGVPERTPFLKVRPAAGVPLMPHV